MTNPSNPSVPQGLCQCGCGKSTTIAPKSSTRYGHVKGEPIRFVKGHNTVSGNRFQFDGAVPFKLDGVYCKLIPLTQGQYAIVDAADYEWLSKHKWHANWDDHKQSFYAVRAVRLGKNKQTLLSMHREVLGLQRGDPREADHIEPSQTLNNSRLNLRPTGDAGNAHNRHKYRNNTSGFKGVGCHPTKPHKYSASIRINGKLLHLGYRDTPQEAHELYCAAAPRHHGAFSREN